MHTYLDRNQRSQDPTPVALVAVAAGLAMLVVAFAMLDRVPGWADEHGSVLVYLGFFVWMSVAGRFTWWGLGKIVERLRNR
ncbi:hypothetical protein ACWIGW_00510 [Nocardia brasiliensis]